MWKSVLHNSNIHCFGQISPSVVNQTETLVSLLKQISKKKKVLKRQKDCLRLIEKKNAALPTGCQVHWGSMEDATKRYRYMLTVELGKTHKKAELGPDDSSKFRTQFRRVGSIRQAGTARNRLESSGIVGIVGIVRSRWNRPELSGIVRIVRNRPELSESSGIARNRPESSESSGIS